MEWDTDLEVCDEALLDCLQVQRQLLEENLVESVEFEIRIDENEAVDWNVVWLQAAYSLVVGEYGRELAILLIWNADRL